MLFHCAHCGKETDRPSGHVNRSRAQGMKLYCGRRCFGLDRRKPKKTKVQKRLEKRLYDIEYRKLNRALLKEKKRAYFQQTYDPEKARVERRKRAKHHAEYCRRPEYKRWKSQYDRRHRAGKFYGPFAEAAMLTMDLNREIKGRMTNAEIKWENLTSNKVQFRRRADKAEERSRPRNHDRRRAHSPALG